MASSPTSTPDPARALEFFRAKMSFTTGPVELSKRMKGGSVRVVDVRSKDDFEREHIPGSINLPEPEWRNASAHGLADDKPNVILCYSQVCHLAARAAVELAAQGLPVMELEGGFDAWKKHHLPTERAGATAPDEPIARARELLAETRAAQQQTQPTEQTPAAAKPAEQEPAAAKSADDANADDAKVDDAKADDAKADDAKADDAKADDAKADDAKADDAKADDAKADDAKADDEAAADPPLRRGRTPQRPAT